MSLRTRSGSGLSGSGFLDSERGNFTLFAFLLALSLDCLNFLGPGC